MRPILTLCAGMTVLAACDTTGLDLDLRDVGRGFDTTAAVQSTVAQRPQPDARGVISYPNYQVAVSRGGDRVADVAGRVGLPAEELARYNGIPLDAPLNSGEILALPRRVSDYAAAGGLAPAGGVDIQTLAGGAINRAGGAGGGAISSPAGPEPVRHQVEAGETAYSIARLYGVSAKALGEWNGLGPDLAVRKGQYLLIPVVIAQAPSVETATRTTQPGQGSPTPTPPSATTPLPAEKTEPAANAGASSGAAKPAPGTPKSPNLGAQATAASGSRMSPPVKGSIVRDFRKGRNDGIDISAPAGSTVSAAAAGTVAAITQDTDRVPILVLRHEGGLLTVYANVDNLKVKKGDRVTRGQSIATLRGGNDPFLHFEVRDGVEAVDPAPYLK
ncbi:MAG: peptidoglycan DD-metalloendopeptidase family protein [Tropicimonas sp.]|uniref:peptidoglycan DD-metalloendopeptidase family protein n=1 Tax=Tropicimonas sp. TaxID=2067044 RepID=UPI003A84358A